jgi:hypothetical protein
MELTIKELKALISDLPDDAILADLGRCSNETFRPFVSIKRVLLLTDERGVNYATINSMGTHFTGNGGQKGLTYKGTLGETDCHEIINGYSVYKCATVCAGLDNCALKNVKP